MESIWHRDERRFERNTCLKLEWGYPECITGFTDITILSLQWSRFRVCSTFPNKLCLRYQLGMFVMQVMTVPYPQSFTSICTWASVTHLIYSFYYCYYCSMSRRVCRPNIDLPEIIAKMCSSHYERKWFGTNLRVGEQEFIEQRSSLSSLIKKREILYIFKLSFLEQSQSSQKITGIKLQLGCSQK